MATQTSVGHQATVSSIITANVTTTGNVQIQHAKTTSGTATVYAGSSIIGVRNN